MALYYPPLTQEQTKRIWEMQMDRTEDLSLQAAPEDTAVALSEWHKKEYHVPGPIIVKGEHFEKVAKVSNEFNGYLYTVKHERADHDRAYSKEHRFDDFNRQQFIFGGQGFGQEQQGYGVPGVWQNTQQGNVMPYAGQAGNMMGGNPIGGGPYGNNTQNQGTFLGNQGWQPGYGSVGNTGFGNMNMAGPSMGNSSGGNNMGTGMSPGSVNVQVLPGQSIQGQMNNPQQQQQQPNPNMGQGGSMQSGFR
ncbi:uncharacterized protein ColSpa_09731 [Colletotrichum spaethianum]|uniref:Uncharacterized protein n=1 Tax=Colletotrichum spaethianum TaxID=700344 RepID=A0AA37PC51_9PEZI|nr:uncharacterized protein ColSpa_09731 [Colletotrichum spaethianum]GKT49550.1 hypothetical protein ColSpa_09731 [Colletotrichum spaethianum]